MHILLTDILSCPRCGPDFGLIVLADRMVDRRIQSGRLGCANCRESYPVLDGVADLRVTGPRPLDPGGDPVEPDESLLLRLAALIGAQPQRSYLCLLEPAGDLAAGISTLLPQANLVSVTPAAPSVRRDQRIDTEEGGGVSRVIAGGRLPFRTGVFRAVAVIGDARQTALEEVRGMLIPGGRVVIDGARGGTAETLRELGFEVLLDQFDAVVAAAPSPR